MDSATEKFLINDKSPSRKVNELDTRGSHFYLAYYWAEALANQDKDADLKKEFTVIAAKMKQNEDKIVLELNNAQGSPQELGGYYMPDIDRIVHAMRPSTILNGILDKL